MKRTIREIKRGLYALASSSADRIRTNIKMAGNENTQTVVYAAYEVYDKEVDRIVLLAEDLDDAVNFVANRIASNMNPHLSFEVKPICLNKKSA